ncbi:MAG: HAMP domain-containing histidine kinase [Peptostreptococcaceae bacterium]|nr:HAMP domain-containing histidine kinase [Peptostreptococcaceae bacterium]
MKKTSRKANNLKIIWTPFFVLFKGLFFLLKNMGKIILFPFKALHYLFETFSSLFKFSIGFKFSFYYSAMFVLLLVFTSFAIVFGFRAYVEIEETKSLEDFSTFLQERIIEDVSEIEKYIDTAVSAESIEVSLRNISGETIYSGKPQENGSLIPYNKELSIPEGKTFFTLGIIEIEESFPAESPSYTLLLRKNLVRQNKYLAMLFALLFIFDIIGILFITITGSKMGKQMMLPIKNMTDSIKHITINDLDAKLDVRGAKDELKELAITFNDMTKRIKDAYEQQNQFVSDASHELRTPISVILGYADMLDRWGKKDEDVLNESVTAIREESRNMKDLTEKLLYLARADKNMIRNEKTEFDMHELIEEIARETRLIDTVHNILCECEEHMPVSANRKAIKQAIRIFIENSRKFTPDGGSITLRSYNKKNKIVLDVEDTGIGIPKGDIPLIFNRFYRVEKSRSKKMGGSGLGLSIAKWIIDEHDGRILVKSKEGEGTLMSIVLPYK